jgi:arsenate reductase-like glutaredoxin family protein
MAGWEVIPHHPAHPAISRYIPREDMSQAIEVQVFGVRKSADTRKALRFFAERRVTTHFVDLTVRAASPGELKRFVQRFGIEALLDRDGRRFADLGLRAARYSDERWLDRLAQEPLLLRMPLVRWGTKLTIGDAEQEWRGWLAEAVG